MIRMVWILGIVLSFALIAVPAYAQTIDPIRGLEVVDSNNKLLGAVNGSNGGLTPAVVIELQGTLFEVHVYEDRLHRKLRWPIVYGA